MSERRSSPKPTATQGNSASPHCTSSADLAALASIVDPALSALPLDDHLTALLGRLLDGSRGVVGEIFLIETGRLQSRTRVAAHTPARGQPDEAGRAAFAGQAIRNQRSIVEVDQSVGGRSTRPYDGATAGWRLGTPLVAGGRAIGAVLLEVAQARPFQPAEEQRLCVLADRAAAAVEQARLVRLHDERSSALAQASAEAASANAELREVEQLKTEFLSMVSHELRTPLTAIIGYTDLLLRGTHGQLNERQLRYQHSVKEASQRLLALVDDLLDVSRLESGQVELELTTVDLAEVFEQALVEARQTAVQIRPTLRVELPADLPRIQGDPVRLRQVLANLLSNAIKFTPSGGRVDLWAEPTEQGRRVRVSVTDTGAGIAPEHLEHIWDRFYQADSSVRRRHGGSGLGLSIVRQLVELHGGTLTATSPGLGRGATFSFEVPVARPATVEARPPAPPRRSPSAPRVLVVEDQQDNRELLSTLLEEMLDVEVLTARDGLEALEQVAQGPSLILLDLMLPRLDGFEVARRLKADPDTRQIPILALTALTRPSEQEEALAAGCDGVVTKPFDTDQLVAAVGARLHLAQRR